MKWTRIVEGARGRHDVTSEDNDTERVVFDLNAALERQQVPPKFRRLSTKIHGSTFQITVNLSVLKYLSSFFSDKS